jgi:hypothetical protein
VTLPRVLGIVALGVLVPGACFHDPPVAPMPPPPIVHAPESGCGDAAAGLERATRDIRAPEISLLGPMRERCLDDQWPVAAITCFAGMKAGELGRCAKLLDDGSRNAVFAQLGGTDRASVAVALARLFDLKVGIAACDQFVATVALILGCDAMPVEMRVQLGLETSDFWQLPTKNLPATAATRMATVCQTSLDTLTKQAATVGCM